MIPADETYDGTWPYAPQFFDGCGFRQHYVDVGEETPSCACTVSRHGVICIAT